MIIFDLVRDDENAPAYQAMAAENLGRQYDFMQSLVDSAFALKRPLISHEIIKALNFHAIACLHNSAGEYRPSEVQVASRLCPPHARVPALMNAFIDEVNRWWSETDPVYLAAFVLWRICWIHPFVNGNGRAARAACYYVLCAKAGYWLPGQPILPELIRANRKPYEDALQHAHTTHVQGQFDLQPLHAFLSALLQTQLQAVPGTGGAGVGTAGTTP